MNDKVVNYCFVPGCAKLNNNLFPLPTSEPCKTQWIESVFVGEAPNELPERLFICSNHFTDDCFSNLWQFRCGIADYLQLRPGSTPSLSNHDQVQAHATEPSGSPSSPQPDVHQLGVQKPLIDQTADHQKSPIAQRLAFSLRKCLGNSPERLHDNRKSVLHLNNGTTEIQPRTENVHGTFSHQDQTKEQRKTQLSDFFSMRERCREQTADRQNGLIVRRPSILQAVSKRKRQGNLEDIPTTECEKTLGGDENSALCLNTGSAETGVVQDTFSRRKHTKEPRKRAKISLSGNQNMDKGHISKKYQCSECEKSFADGLMLISHLENHGRDEIMKDQGSCKICGQTFKSPFALARHMNILHEDIITYECPLCDKSFRTYSDFQVHKVLHDPNRPFYCHTCTCRFLTKRALNVHISHSHPGVLTGYACKRCNRYYSSKLSLQIHNNKFHSIASDNNTVHSQANDIGAGSDASVGIGDDSSSAQFFPCLVCAEIFTTSKDLEDHQHCHLPDKRHECKECGECFSQLVNLQTHQRSHQSELNKHATDKSQQYCCSKCNFTSSGRCQLAEHKSTHNVESVSCDLCDLTFSCKSSREEHYKIHNKQEEELPTLIQPSLKPPMAVMSATHLKPSSDHFADQSFMCKLCRMTFSTKAQLGNHERCHWTATTQFECTKCGEILIGPEAFREHQCATRQRLHGKIGQKVSSTVKSKQSSKTPRDNDVKVGEDFFKCSTCNSRFLSEAHLLYHYNKHVECRPFKCTVCGKRYATRRYLNRHKVKHDDDSISEVQFEDTH